MPRPRIIDHLDDFAEEIGAQVTAGATNDEILAKLRKDHGLQIGKRTLQSWLSRYSQGSLKRRTPVSKEILETAVSKVIRKKAFKNVGYRKVCAVLDSTGLHADKYRVAMILKKLSPEDVAARMKLPKSPGAAPTPKKKDDAEAASASPSVSRSPSPSPPASPRSTKRTKAEVEAPAAPAAAAAAAPAPDSAKAMPKSKLPPKKRAKSPSPSASPPPSPKAAPAPAAAATPADTKSPANKRKATSPKKAVKPEELAVSPSKRGGRRNSTSGPKAK